jgi:DNA replication protein DnaC
MLPDDLLTSFRALGFCLSPEALDAFLTHAHKSRLGAVQVLEQLLSLEKQQRDQRNLARRTVAAALGSFTPLDRFDWSHPRKLDRALYQQLLSLDFVKPGHNVLLRGPSGVGKTTLAKNLGIEALKHGASVRFTTLACCLGDLLKQESAPALERRLRRYTHPDVLILDEIGYLPQDTQGADLFYNLISRRHEQRSTVITTNLPFKQWGALFPGAACIAALIDRFAQHCIVLDIEADSYRQKRSPHTPTL